MSLEGGRAKEPQAVTVAGWWGTKADVNWAGRQVEVTGGRDAQAGQN